MGAKATPRRTSPWPADWSVVKLSFAACPGVVKARVSVIPTSLFGSAPWSPEALTVEVMPKSETLPSLFTVPVRFRRPSVAGSSWAGRPTTPYIWSRFKPACKV